MNNNFEIKIEGKRGAGNTKLTSHLFSSIGSAHIIIIGDHYADCKDYVNRNEPFPRNQFIEYEYQPNWVIKTARLIENMTNNYNRPCFYKPEESYYLIIEVIDNKWERECINELIKEINATNIIPVYVSIINE